jgi:hypothetical protein
MDLDRRGIPGGFIASAEFVEAAASQAKSLGFDPTKVFVGHPIQDRTNAEMELMAEQAFEEVLTLIFDSSAD